MEKTDTSQEPNMRLNFKQNSKAEFYCEWTSRGNTIEEIEARNSSLRELALSQLKTLNLR